MKEVKTIELKDKITLVLMIWSNIIATASLIVTTIQGKRNTAPKKPTKHKRKR